MCVNSYKIKEMKVGMEQNGLSEWHLKWMEETQTTVEIVLGGMKNGQKRIKARGEGGE